MCGEWKPKEAFAFRNKATGRRQDHCRICHAAYRRRHYLANRSTYIKREVDRIRGYREGNRDKIIAYLREHPCVDCGETDVVVLDFDHRDPSFKKANIGALAAKKPWKHVFEEIEKCDVRCASCHRRRTAKQQMWRKALPIQFVLDVGAVGRPTTVPDAQPPSQILQTCTNCGETKPLGAFAYRSVAKGTRLKRCRSCCSETSRRHYVKNRRSYISRNRTRRHRERAARLQYVLEFLDKHPCVDCSEKDPVVLDFDHRDRNLKRANVAELVRRGTWPRLIAEIEKCDVRCANCHRRRTARQMAWKKVAAA